MLVLSGEHSSELRPDTLLASDGCEALGPGLVMTMAIIPMFFSIFQWKWNVKIENNAAKCHPTPDLNYIVRVLRLRTVDKEQFYTIHQNNVYRHLSWHTPQRFCRIINCKSSICCDMIREKTCCSFLFINIFVDLIKWGMFSIELISLKYEQKENIVCLKRPLWIKELV